MTDPAPMSGAELAAIMARYVGNDVPRLLAEIERQRIELSEAKASVAYAAAILSGDVQWEAATALKQARRERDTAQAHITAVRELHPRVPNTERESAQDPVTGHWIQPAEICGECHVFEGTYDPCSRYMWPCPTIRALDKEQD